VFVGTPKLIREQVMACQEQAGGFEIASCQLNFDDLPFEMAAASARRMGSEVLTHFQGLAPPTNDNDEPYPTTSLDRNDF
jgi:hypothetical protein